MKIAAAQMLVSHDPRENGAAARALMRQAADAGVQLIQFSEGALSGYALKDEETDWDGVASELEQVIALAAELKLWTVLGCNHRLSSHRPHNSLYVISDTGAVAARYDKRLCSLNEITNYFSPGFEPVVFEAGGFTFGLALCIEESFPELFMEYERLGVDCVLFSSHSKDAMSGVLAQAHAATNSCWLGVSVPAQFAEALPSGVIGPDGRWLRQCSARSTPDLAIADLDRSDTRFDIALNKARPWRRVSRDGAIYERHRIADPRSTDKRGR